MSGVLLIAICVLIATACLWVGVRVRCQARSASEHFGLSGLGVLIILGWIPGVDSQYMHLKGWFFGIIGLCSAIGLASYFLAPAESRKLGLEKLRPVDLINYAAMLPTMIFGMMKALVPGDMVDWDTYAYHFAVPKIWLTNGTNTFLPALHQSNFPFLVDDLYLYGLTLSGESASRTFSILFVLFGACLVTGFTKRHTANGQNAVFVSAAIFGSIPMVAWSAGSGYIDIAHGIFAGFAMLYIAETLATKDFSQNILVAGLLLGAAAGSKYTGLQTMGICLIVLLGGILASKAANRLFWRQLGIASALAIVVACPWYIRNIQNTGNPVFPFFFEKLGGRGWNEERAKFYTEEQNSFGVGFVNGKRDLTTIGHAILGLGYQPGRYVNPQQTEGNGFPVGALGAAALVALLGAAVLGVKSATVRWYLLMVFISLLAWTVLTQQVRYLAAMIPGAAILGGIVVAQFRAKTSVLWAISITTIAQFNYTLKLMGEFQGSKQMPVVTGVVSPDDYLASQFSFYPAARDINVSKVDSTKVALYDEVFGYLLNTQYFWANPGHSMLIDYEHMDTPEQLVSELKRNNVTTIYFSLDFQEPEVKAVFQQMRTWAAMDGTVAPVDFSPQTRFRLGSDLRTKWIPLLYDAAVKGLIGPPHCYPSPDLNSGAPAPTGILWEIAPKG